MIFSYLTRTVFLFLGVLGAAQESFSYYSETDKIRLSFLWDDITGEYNRTMVGKERTTQQLKQFFDTFKKKVKLRLKIANPSLTKAELGSLAIQEWKDEVKRCQDSREGTFSFVKVAHFPSHEWVTFCQ